MDRWMQRRYSKYSSPGRGQLEEILYQQNEHWPLCPLFVYPLIIKLGLLNGLNPSVCPGKEPEVLLTIYHLLKPRSWTSAVLFRLESLAWPARFSHTYPCNSLGIPLCFCILGISVWIVRFSPTESQSFHGKLIQGCGKVCPTCWSAFCGKTVSISPEDT